MIEAINKLKCEHQTRTLVRNQPAAEQQAKADEARGTVIKKSKHPGKTRSQEPDTQRANRQSEKSNEEREEGQGESPAQADQSEEKGVETEQHSETRAEEQSTNHDEGVMEEQEGFEEVVYGRKRRRQQVIIGISRESEIKAEKKKAWIYLGRMTQETTTGVRNFLNRKGIKEEVLVEELKTMGPYKAFKLGFSLQHLRLTENQVFWAQGAIIRPFRISYRAWRQHRGAMVDM